MVAIKEFVNWVSSILQEYNQRSQLLKHHRCKVVSIEKNKSGLLDALVKIDGTQGIRSSFPIPYPVQEIVSNEALLSEFSQVDVRTLTFYAFYEKFALVNKITARYKINLQELHNDNTLFVIYDNLQKGYLRKFAKEIFNDNDMLMQFDLNDVKNIVFTATQEATMKNMESFYCAS